MGEEADYLRENDSYYLRDQLLHGVIPWYAVENSPIGDIKYKPVLRIGLDPDNKIQALLFLTNDYEHDPSVYVTLEFKATEADVNEATKQLMHWLRDNDFRFNNQNNVYYKVTREATKQSIRALGSSFRELEKSILVVRLYTRNGRLRLKFSRQPLEKQKKRLRELEFRYDKAYKDWIYTGVSNEEARGKIARYFSNQNNTVIL